MKLTEERIIPDQMDPSNGLLLEHLARYQFAILYAKGRVLDIACGSGYGAVTIAKAAKKRIDEVVGVDVDDETIEYARGRYHHPLITYQQSDCLDASLPDRLGLFETIISFETIEHLQDDIRFIDILYRMLKPGGTLILSTPFGQGRGMPTNELFHVHQLTKEQFIELFDRFNKKQFYYQKGVLVEPEREGVHYPIGIAVVQK